MIKPGLGEDVKRTIFRPEATIGSIPPFVRINSIEMRFFVRSIVKLLPLFQQFRGAFTESPYYSFLAPVNNFNYPKDCFRAPSQFFSCLTNQVLPILDGCVPKFGFSICCQEPNETMQLVDSLIKLPQVQASSIVFFFVNGSLRLNPQSHMHQSLQIDGISNWLHQQIVETPTPPKDYRILKIIEVNRFAFLIRLNSVRQLIDSIKAVSPNFSYSFFNAVLLLRGSGWCKVKSGWILFDQKKPKSWISVVPQVLRKEAL